MQINENNKTSHQVNQQKLFTEEEMIDLQLYEKMFNFHFLMS